MKTIYLVSLIIIFCILISPGIFALGIRLIPNGFQPSLDMVQRVYQDLSISQHFTAENAGLSGIGVSIKNPNLTNKKDISLSLYHKDNLIRQVTLNGRSIEDGNFVKFIFDPIKDSNGQEYNAVFTAPEATPGEALEIFLTKNPLGPTVKVGKDNRSEGLSNVIFYRPSSPLSIALDVYEKWFNKFIADLPFAIFYVSVILALACLALKPSKKI